MSIQTKIDKILILMSTYNGEQYLEEQLDSIFLQEEVDINLLVRDDGSTDSTLEILQKYSIKYPNRIEIITGKNIGWKKSFFSLMSISLSKYPDIEYFAFADQDDIWLPEKLKIGINKLGNLLNGAKLYCSNQYYYKNGRNWGKIRKSIIHPTAKNCLVRNYATGCTIVFNRNLLQLSIREIPQIDIAHDYWIYLTAVLCGYVYIDDDAYILYRQHQNNQIGSKSSIKDIWMRRLKNLKSILSNHEREIMAKELLRILSKDMHSEGFKATNKLANYRNNLNNQLSLLLDKEYSLNKKSNNFWFKLRIIFRKV